MIDVEKVIADIARNQLHIQTLETRRSDSLDFHEVSVWNLRIALLCAFEAGRNARGTKPRVIKTRTEGKEGTSYRATIEASFADLVEVWGKPYEGDGFKTEAEWVIRYNGNTTITIYNYKNSRCYADKYPDIAEVREWHVGGKSADVVKGLLQMMHGRAKLLHIAD